MANRKGSFSVAFLVYVMDTNGYKRIQTDTNVFKQIQKDVRDTRGYKGILWKSGMQWVLAACRQRGHWFITELLTHFCQQTLEPYAACKEHDGKEIH